MLKNISHFIAAAALGLMLAGCGKSERTQAYTTMEGSVWHTTMHITYGSERDLSDNIMAVTDSVELSLSPFISYSHISAINRNENMQVDDYITQVFDESVRINRLSGGAFDPTVAPLINLWGFGYENGDGEPDEAAIDSCLTLTGIDRCRIEDGVMVKKAPGTQFNFSAITKGFGIDCLAAMLRGEGIDNYMVEIGGEVAVSGVNPRGDKWRIQIDSPESDKTSHERLAVIEVTDCCLATSGNYRNYRDTEHGRVGHTISPVTGRPVASNVLSATVIAPTAMTADALATALMAMDADAGIAMIESQPDVDAMLVIAAGDTLTTLTTSTFPTIIR
ncbi:MAG: FAD:protein FMN transferase [Bacteroidales bacterium]|nr:FAD:protein FMN transferase [Bacteroidales bacterium]